MRWFFLSLVLCIVLGMGATGQESKPQAIQGGLGGREIVSESREITIDGTKVVLLCVAKEAHWSGDLNEQPLTCIRISYLTEYVGEEPFLNTDTGMAEIRLPGSNQIIWPGVETKHTVWNYSDRRPLSLLEPPEVASKEHAFYHEFLGMGGISEDHVDCVLRDIGFNGRKIDVVFRNVRLK